MRRFVLLSIAFGAVPLVVVAGVGTRAAAPYVHGARDALRQAPPGDRSPPRCYLSASRKVWPNQDSWVASSLLRDFGGASRQRYRVLRELFVMAVMRVAFSRDQRESLAAVHLPAYGGRGLTVSARAEFGLEPRDLTDSQVVWLLTVGQRPICSKANQLPKVGRDQCDRLFRSLLGLLDSA